MLVRSSTRSFHRLLIYRSKPPACRGLRSDPAHATPPEQAEIAAIVLTVRAGAGGRRGRGRRGRGRVVCSGTTPEGEGGTWPIGGHSGPPGVIRRRRWICTGHVSPSARHARGSRMPPWFIGASACPCGEGFEGLDGYGVCGTALSASGWGSFV